MGRRDVPNSSIERSRSGCALLRRCPNSFRILILASVLQITWSAGGASGSGSGVLSCSGSGSGRRLGGAPWYCEPWEKDHLEAMSSALMVAMAVAFELVYHHLHHMAEHAFVYGQCMLSEEERHEHVQAGSLNKPLGLMLFARCSGEFMVLGFLAFTIWTLNQRGVFDEVAGIENQGIRLPLAGVDYLHLLEEVHMQLFVANVLYFTLCYRVVKGSDQRIKDFEWCREQWVNELMMRTVQSHISKPTQDSSGKLEAFKYWRGHFLTRAVPEVLKWKDKAPHAFENLMHSMHITKPRDEVQLEDLSAVFTGRFSFCSYCSFCVIFDTIHFINMGNYTMGLIVLLKLFMGLTHRYGQVGKDQIAPVLSLLCFVILLITYIITRLFKKALAHEEIQEIRGLEWLPQLVLRLSYKIDCGVLMLSSLQILVFFLCHSWSGYMIDKNFWSGIFDGGDKQLSYLLYLFTYVGCLCALGYFLPRVLPDTSTVMALPPFFSFSNQDMIQHVAVQVVDAKMVAAREALAKKLHGKEAAKEGEGEGDASAAEAAPAATSGASKPGERPSTDTVPSDSSGKGSASKDEKGIDDVTTGASKDRLAPKKKPKGKKLSGAIDDKKPSNSTSKTGSGSSAVVPSK